MSEIRAARSSSVSPKGSCGSLAGPGGVQPVASPTAATYLPGIRCACTSTIREATERSVVAQRGGQRAADTVVARPPYDRSNVEGRGRPPPGERAERVDGCDRRRLG